MDKKDILDLKQSGKSNRSVAKELGIDRKTVARYWNEFQQLKPQLEKEGADTRTIQDEMFKTPKYHSSEKKQQNRKYTEEIDARLREILSEERRKDSILGHGHKQKLTKNGQMEEEKKCLTAYRPPLELAEISNNLVNPSSMINVDTAFYSVPEELVRKKCQ